MEALWKPHNLSKGIENNVNSNIHFMERADKDTVAMSQDLKY